LSYRGQLLFVGLDSLSFHHQLTTAPYYVTHLLVSNNPDKDMYKIVLLYTLSTVNYILYAGFLL
jgi:hypothetical protein